jgi:hypothetical protein
VNWTLIFKLSLFGLGMAFATVFVVPSNLEPFCWLAIFIACATVIARSGVDRPFLHGLSVSLVNSVWITSAHIALYDWYIPRHPQEAAMAGQMGSPRLLMLLTGPVVGLVSGVVLGLFTLAACKIVRSKPTHALS